MKTHYILCAAMLLPQLALASASSGNESAGKEGAASCGTVQATLDYCARIKPGDAARYREQAKHIVGGRFQNTSEYKDGYASAQNALKKVSEREGREACADFLQPVNMHNGHDAEGKPEKHDDDHDGRHDDHKH